MKSDMEKSLTLQKANTFWLIYTILLALFIVMTLVVFRGTTTKNTSVTNALQWSADSGWSKGGWQ